MWFVVLLSAWLNVRRYVRDEVLRKFPFFGCHVIPLITFKKQLSMIWQVIFRGSGRGDPGPFSWIHAVFLVRKKRITLGCVNWSLFWFIISVYPFPNLSTRETIYVDCKQALRLGDVLKNKNHNRTIMALVKSHAHAALEKRRARERLVALLLGLADRFARHSKWGLAPRRPFAKAETTTVSLGGASCKRDFCIPVCSLRELKM